MKNQLLTRVSTFVIISLLALGCAKKKDPTPSSTTISLSDPNAVLNALIVSGGSKLSGSLPSASYSSYAPTIDLGGSSSYTSATTGGSFTLPFEFSSSNIFQGIYLSIPGASSYYKVPFNNSYSSTYYSGTGEVSVSLPSNISTGSFTVNYAGYDSYGYVSSPISRQISVSTSPVTPTYGGTGSYTFNGSSYSGTAYSSYTSTLGNQYSIVSSNGTSFIISFGPSSGSVSVSSAYYTGSCSSTCSTAAQFTSGSTYDSYYATSGTVSKSGSTITFNVTMKLASSTSSSTYTLSGSMTI